MGYNDKFATLIGLVTDDCKTNGQQCAFSEKYAAINYEKIKMKSLTLHISI